MRTSIQVLLAMILVLIVILGIYAAGSTVFNSAGGNIKKGGDESGVRMDCIFQNPRSADSACKSDSALEVKANYDARKI